MTEKHSNLRVTQKQFAKAVGCSESTASRFRAGERFPGRELLGRIIKEFNLDPAEAMQAFVGPRKEFGEYMCRAVFLIDEDDLARDRALSSIRYS